MATLFFYLCMINPRILLLPFSPLYAGITYLRNKLFDWNILPSKQYSTPLISVGNITVGGTGKTPLTEYLIKILQPHYQNIALLSRGYKRQTKGAILADKNSTVSQIGDEPFQILQGFPKLNVAVAEKRVEGMDLLLKQNTPDAVILDDAYQHRYITPGLSILVIDYNRPMWKDFTFPAGNLRECSSGKDRAHIMVVNKCPINLSQSEKNKWQKKLNPRNNQQIFFTCIDYGEPKPMDSSNATKPPKDAPIIGLAGIAQPQPFKDYLSKHYTLTDFTTYPDHHNFSPDDIHKISHSVNHDTPLFTTEKDAVRLASIAAIPHQVKSNIWYIPIELKILFEEQTKFENTIIQYVSKNQRIN